MQPGNTPPPNYIPYIPPKPRIPIAMIIVVIVIVLFFVVAIGAAILFPVFAQARNKARVSACLSNSKQQALGVLMYAQDYDEVLPAASNWMGDISPYISNEGVFHCPEVSPRDSKPDIYGYAYIDSNSRKKLEKIASPQTERMTYESTDTQRNAHNKGASPDQKRHHGVNVTTYVDGHAKALKRTEEEN